MLYFLNRRSPFQQQRNVPFRQESLRKKGGVRGLQRNPLFTPLNGFAFGEGSGVSFVNGQSLSKAEAAGISATSKTVGAGGGFGGGVGYVNAFDVGSAYGGGNGGGNVSSIESKYGVNAGAYTSVKDNGLANSTFNGVSAGGGFGSGLFGGLFVTDPDQSLSDALAETAQDLASSNSKDGKGKDKDKESVNLQEAAASLNAGFYANFGNTTGGGGGGFGFTGLQASGIVSAAGGQNPFATANSGVNASANGFGFGGGKTNVGDSIASGGGFGGGQANGGAGGDITANEGVDQAGGGLVEFNATGGGGANGGGSGFVGIGLNPADIAGAYEFSP